MRNAGRLREREPTLDIAQLRTLVLFRAIIVPLIGYFYGRQRRWISAAGWLLLLGGQVVLMVGGGEWFAWGGLVWLSVSAFGIILVLVDMLTHRRGPTGD